MTRRARWWVIGAAGVVAALVGAVAVVTLRYDSRGSIDIYGFLRPDAGISQQLPGGRMATDDLCPGVTGCVQAVDADTAVIRTFKSREQAEQRAVEVERAGTDVHLSGWILVEYKVDELSERERGFLEQYIDGLHVNSPD